MRSYEKVNSKGAESLRIAIAGYLTWSLKRSVKQSDGIVISNMLDIMLKPIYESGKLGDMVMYNRLFKATLIVRESKIKGDN